MSFKTKEFHKNNKGYVYCCLVSPLESAPYLKIGYSCQPDQRAEQLESNSKLSCKLLDVWEAQSQPAAKALEYEIHQALKEYSLVGGYWKRESFRRGAYRSLQEYVLHSGLSRVYKNTKIIIES
ncbi:GIY-YIG nuclease family protein [Aeromonas sp. QDB18]|uniref:GIY-YIG nuclease family protein n=1 Tax=Aeromonas sp. QDB18 TaxID=2990486 RepID=UPI0022E79568|nr:GIY-YIG nuclease family protein [Aeromonas sp. QDB18]